VKIVDNYRWLEDGSSADTRKWVAEEMAYTQSVLDPLPGRDAIHKRLTELLSIGSISQPEIGGKYYYLHAARGDAEPAVLYVRKVVMERSGAAGSESAGGGWNHCARLVSRFGKWKIFTYGTSRAVGDEQLHILETKTGKLLPIDRADAGVRIA